ncbi:hypothetical protein LguiB_032425 [Lonicera macranthoides]
MSGTPNKRLHEEGGGHSSASKYPPHEDSGMYPNVAKLTTSSSTNEYHNTHTPFDTVQDARMPKIPRAEARDADRRSPLLPTPYRMSSSSNDSHSDHPVTSENRDFKVDTKVEPRELYHQGAKGEKDIRFDTRGGDDNKETKYDRGDAYPDYKGENKDVYTGGGNSHFNWKELKEQQHRGKRYPDNTPPGGNVDLWHSSSRTTNLHGPAEVGKEGSTIMEDIEAHEAVGENKVDIKGGDDKFKDKDRKRKDGKQHREWGGERDKERSDRRQQLGNSSNESPKEEREAEKWERERKDLLKEKDKLKDREKDHTKREVWSAAEKEGLDPEKDAMDVSGRATEQENSTLEQKKQKDHDSWKNVDRGEANKDRRKERDNTDVEGERAEKRSRCYDKESDDGGCVDAEGGGTERERGAFNYGVQQRKRMLRPRGSPQVGNREPRFRSRTQDNEGYASRMFLLLFTELVNACKN